MKKYLYSEKIGNILFSAAVLVGLLTMSIDIDHSEHPVIAMLIGWGVVGILAVVGFALMYLSTVEGILLAALVIGCAAIYRLFRCPIRFMHECYKIKRQTGPTYKVAFFNCIDRYDSYIFHKEHKCIMDVSKEA